MLETGGQRKNRPDVTLEIKNTRNSKRLVLQKWLPTALSQLYNTRELVSIVEQKKFWLAVSANVYQSKKVGGRFFKIGLDWNFI